MISIRDESSPLSRNLTGTDERAHLSPTLLPVCIFADVQNVFLRSVHLRPFLRYYGLAPSRLCKIERVNSRLLGLLSLRNTEVCPTYSQGHTQTTERVRSTVCDQMRRDEYIAGILYIYIQIVYDCIYLTLCYLMLMTILRATEDAFEASRYLWISAYAI